MSKLRREVGKNYLGNLLCRNITSTNEGARAKFQSKKIILRSLKLAFSIKTYSLCVKAYRPVYNFLINKFSQRRHIKIKKLLALISLIAKFLLKLYALIFEKSEINFVTL